MTCLVIRSSFVVQAYGSLEEEWDSQRFMSQMLRKFQTFANKVFNIFHFCRIIFCQVIASNWLTWWLYQVNSQCDGDRDSYDAMILLTGRFDYHDVRPGLKIFFIFIRSKALGLMMVSYFGMGARYVVNKTWPQILIRWHQKLISWHQFKPGTKN